MEQQSAPDWMEWVAKLGFLAKSAVYMIIGALALQVAHDGASGSMGTDGALSSIAAQPFGQVLLWATAIGLFAYAAWRLTQAAVDPGNEGSDAEGLGKRIGYASSGVLHVVLAVAAAKKALGAASASASGSRASSWTAAVMEQPWGRWLIVLVGVGIGIAAAVQAYRAYSQSFMDKLDGDMSADEKKWTERIGSAGFGARAVVFAIVAYFLASAGLTANSQQSVGLDGALRTLASQSYGSVLLTVTAAGLFLYGIFMAVKARYFAFPES